jgi:hypothetical protein
MDENREFQIKRKSDIKEQNKKDDKEFVDYWKERMKQLVSVLFNEFRKRMNVMIRKKLDKGTKGFRTSISYKWIPRGERVRMTSSQIKRMLIRLRLCLTMSKMTSLNMLKVGLGSTTTLVRILLL